jgi:hypothetical protein
MYQPQHLQDLNVHLPLEILSIIIFHADTYTKIVLLLTSQTMPHLVLTTYQVQMCMWLATYLPPDIQQYFWESLNETHSLVIGSVAMYMLFPSIATPSLDMAAPKLLTPAWNNFLQKQGYQKSNSPEDVEHSGLKPVLML